MVLGLIELLIGKRKKKGTNLQQQQAYKTGAAPIGSNPRENIQEEQKPQEDNTNDKIKFGGNEQIQKEQNTPQTTPSGQKRPIQEILSKIQSDLKEGNNKMSEMVGEIKEVQNNLLTLTHRIDLLDEDKKINEEKFSEIDTNMNKFLSLYELVNNQYSPFVDKEEPQITHPKEIIIDNHGTTTNPTETSDNTNDPKFDIFTGKGNDINSAFLELDTLNIQEAAGNAVPLVRIKNDTNSLVVILSWLEYMIKKVGIEETRNNLRYYTEILRWLTPEVYFELDKYLRGMKDKSDLKGDESIEIKDHIVSLYFISKLNEKTLDDKLTKAVISLMKQT